MDFENGVINVQRTILQDAQKGGFYFGTPKTKKSKRKIPLTNEAYLHQCCTTKYRNSFYSFPKIFAHQ